MAENIGPGKKAGKASLEDPELVAMQDVVAALSPLDEESRFRVLEYAARRLNLNLLGLGSSMLSGASVSQRGPVSQVYATGPDEGLTAMRDDIRSLREEKQPRSASEMAALVAYYLAEVPSAPENKGVITADDLKRYFKQAKAPLPPRLDMTLVHAKNAGYLESAGGRGVYRLTPVGYNLVVHQLPRRGGDTASPAGKRPRRKKS